jgi:hypothetical protein
MRRTMQLSSTERSLAAVRLSGWWQRDQRLLRVCNNLTSASDLAAWDILEMATSHPDHCPRPVPLAQLLASVQPAYVALLDGPNDVPSRPVGLADPSARPDGPRAPSGALPRIIGRRAQTP